MAKKYYQSKKARKDEHMGMERYERGPVIRKDEYAGPKNSKKMMKRDGAMIKADWNAPALLPQQVIDREWPSNNKYAAKGYMDDLFMGVQKQLNEDRKDFKKILKPSKY